MASRGPHLMAKLVRRQQVLREKLTAANLEIARLRFMVRRLRALLKEERHG